MRKFTKKNVATVAVVALAVSGAGIAYAAWTATGAGDGSVTGDSAIDLVVTSAPVVDLYPTGTKTIEVKVENPNPYAVRLTDLTVGTISVPEGSDCNVVSVTAPDTVFTATQGFIAAESDDTYDIVVSMSNAANDNCQGETFTIPVTANGASSADAS